MEAVLNYLAHHSGPSLAIHGVLKKDIERYSTSPHAVVHDLAVMEVSSCAVIRSYLGQASHDVLLTCMKANYSLS